MTFLNIHILQTIPFSNLNRDDSGSPKSVIYGGTNRARLSSQALKRAARTNFEAASSADMTHRTKYASDHLLGLVSKIFLDLNVQPTEAMLAEIKQLSLSEIRKLTAKEKTDAKNNEPGDTLVWLAESETFELANKIVNSVRASEDQLGMDGWIQSATSSLTIACFGRMFAAAPNVQTEAAIQVAHAFTTHATSTEIDYFTAVDDWRERYEGDKGAGHLDLAEFTSGVFYRYFNIDRAQLAENWSDIQSLDASDRLIALFKSLVLSLPSGKTNVTAPNTLPMLIVVEESSWPVSFADAFEGAIPESDKGFASASRDRFLDYQSRARATMSSLFGTTMVMDLTADGSASLDDLATFSANWILDAVTEEAR